MREPVIRRCYQGKENTELDGIEQHGCGFEEATNGLIIEFWRSSLDEVLQVCSRLRGGGACATSLAPLVVEIGSVLHKADAEMRCHLPQVVAFFDQEPHEEMMAGELQKRQSGRIKRYG